MKTVLGLQFYTLEGNTFVYDCKGQIHGYDNLGNAISRQPSLNYLREEGEYIHIQSIEECGRLLPNLPIDDLLNKI